MPGRTLSGAEGYRYAYQGQEKDPETGKEAFQLRLWDARIGRWLTTDPAGQYSSPYLGMGNNPLRLIDPDGGTANDIIFLGTDGKEFRVITGDPKDVYVNVGVPIVENGSLDLTSVGVRDNSIIGNLFYGVEASASLSFSIALGVDVSYAESRVRFLGGPYAQYWYKYRTDFSKGGGDSAIKFSNELEAAGVGVGLNFFVGYFNGDPVNIDPRDLAGDFKYGENTTIGYSIALGAELYAKEIISGQYTSYHYGANVTAGFSLGTAWGGYLSTVLVGGGKTKLVNDNVIPTYQRPLWHLVLDQVNPF